MIAFNSMAPLACLMHWYISMLYVVPVLAIGGWCWWSTKRTARRKAQAGGSGTEAGQTPASFEATHASS